MNNWAYVREKDASQFASINNVKNQNKVSRSNLNKSTNISKNKKYDNQSSRGKETKTSEIVINLGEIKNFGPLEIKVLKCGKIESDSKNYSVAYLQVKDLSENQNEKVFIFNGWTFSAEPTISPFDHAIYDLQLVNCNNA